MNVRFYDEKEAKRFCDAHENFTTSQCGVHVTIDDVEDDFEFDMMLLPFKWRDYDC